MRIAFTKMEGAGNDFVVIDAIATGFDADALGEARRARLGDRHRGIGFDQLLVLDAPRTPANAASYRIFNSDGREAAQCGNGVRCLARYLADRGGEATMVLESPAGPVAARVERDGTVAVEMGEPDFDPAASGLAQPRADRYTLETSAGPASVGVVSMGNPHAVSFVDDLEETPVATLGAALQHAFADGVNAGFAQIVDRGHLKLRVWERGVGETLACGTGASAAAAVAQHLGLAGQEVTVDLPGGRLVVRWAGPGSPLWLQGPAQRVYEGRIEL